MSNRAITVFFFIVILIIIIAIPVIWYYNSTKKQDSIKPVPPPAEVTITIPGLGNVLAEYFGTIAWYFVYGQDAHVKINYTYSDIDYIKQLPDFIPYDPEIASRLLLIPQIKEKTSNWFLRMSDWSYNRGILSAMAPLIRKIRSSLDEKSITCQSSTTPDVVIHFRCADAPRNRHYEYVFQKFKWYQIALERAATQLGKKVEDLSITILSCTDFNLGGDNEQKKQDEEKQTILCSSVVKALVSYLNINVSVKCGSVREDFLLMMNTPCLISSGSSLSYLAALTNENLMITPDYLHTDNLYYRDNWVVLPSEELKHDDVVDYDDIPTVISKLS